MTQKLKNIVALQKNFNVEKIKGNISWNTFCTGIGILVLYFIIRLAVKDAIKESTVDLENSMKESVKSSLLEYDWAKNNKE